jgi:prepilin-type N-terminal cleavage/methylation domain-containing protein
MLEVHTFGLIQRHEARRLRRFAGNRGFSLLELMLVAAIIIVVLAIALPNLTVHDRNYRLRNDCNNIANLFTLARMHASAEFARVKVTCDSTTKSCTYQTYQYTPPSSSTLLTNETNNTKVILSNGVSFDGLSGLSNGAGGQDGGNPAQGLPGQSNPYTIWFNSRGMPIDGNTGSLVTNYAFYLIDQPNNLTMAIAPDINGRPIIYNLNGSEWTVVQE